MKRIMGKGLAGAGALAAGLYAPEARAFEVGFVGDAGAFVGWTFGGPGAGFTWGIEGRAMAWNTDLLCDNSGLRPYGGGVVRLSFSDGYRPMLGAGLVLGTYLNEVVTAGVEAGVGYDFGQTPRLDLWVGGEAQFTFAALRSQIRILDGSATVAPTFRFPGAQQDTACFVEGRPRRDESGVAPLPGLHLEGEPIALDERERRVVDAWCQRARIEWASVPAFLELATQLTLAEAPEALVRAARRAAADETRHAVDSARIAARIDGAPVRLHAQDGLQRRLLAGPEARARLAVESFLDGCLQEGAAAACAFAEAQRGQDPGIQAAQARIAEDEARHAELGWAVLDWLLDAQDEPSRAALEAALVAEGVAVDDEKDRALEVFGVLSGQERARLTARVQERARDRLRRRLRA